MRLKSTVFFFLCAIMSMAQSQVPQWEQFETSFTLHTAKNPFTDVTLKATFTHAVSGKVITVDGFYDGDDTYRIRFMPTEQGKWTYTTRSSEQAMSGKTGAIECVKPINHGMVSAGMDHDFHYADGTPYRPVGTTSYAWIHADEQRQELTYQSLQEAAFNKLRFCVFPNNSVYELPSCYPFQLISKQKDEKGKDQYVWDFTRFDVHFFQHLDQCVKRLRELNIEADLILFTPYDEGLWGFDRMTPENNIRYVRYVVARLASYSNIWWSMANEWNLVKAKTVAEWDELTEVVVKADPYRHLLSTHGGTAVYTDYNRPVFTHASIQDQGPLYNFEGAATVRNIIHKPVIFDEVCYEGDLRSRWAQLSGQEMLQRIYTGLMAGTYVTHGECFAADAEDYTGFAFLATGGKFQGECPKRIPFLRQLLDALPHSPRLADQSWDPVTATAGEGHYLIYLGKDTPAKWTFNLPTRNSRWPRLEEGKQFFIDIIDTWNMTTTRYKHPFTTKSDGTRYRMVDEKGRSVTLPRKPYLLLHIHP